ncbi:zinc finger protein dpff-1 [Armigeres subalbatus]|uniref:zinc finger protein dpff-1 n=1 Tax=Armigeres subalbatus TaxID=124917 RepID=UPI002ED27AA0
MAKTKTNAEMENGVKSSPTITEATTASSSSSSGTPALPPESDNISTRVGSRTKKAKVVFDPSDNYVPRKRVRKADLPSSEPPVGSSKSENLISRSPSKSDGPATDNGTVPKLRLTLSPASVTTTKQISATLLTTSYSRPKVLGGGPSSSSSSTSDALAGGLSEPGGSGNTVRKHDFIIKREPNCDMCHKVEQQRRGFKLIDCPSCAFRAHSKCLRAHPVYQKFPIRINFRCFQCIECVVCGKSLRGGNLLFCCNCQNAFHSNCHGPSNSDSPWVCKRCLGIRSPVKQPRSEPEKPPTVEAKRPESIDNADDEAHQEFAGFSDNEMRKDSFSLSDSGPVNDSSLQPDDMEDDEEDDEEEEDEENDEQQEDEEDEEADDMEPADQNDSAEENNDVVNDEEKFDPRLDNFEEVHNWSCEDVYQYFNHYFPDYAHLFKEQEIDGPSLVLMRKSDVLSGFGLKLGPAISLYQRIVMMQNNDRDFRLTWI